MKDLHWLPYLTDAPNAAFSGAHCVAIIGCRSKDGRWWWQINALKAPSSRQFTYGEVATRSAAKRAVEKAWRRLLEAYGLKVASPASA